MRRFFAERHDALLAALPVHVHRLPLEVDVDEVEPDDLRASQPARVEELEQRSVPEGKRRVALDELEQRCDLVLLRRVRQPPRP